MLERLRRLALRIAPAEAWRRPMQVTAGGLLAMVIAHVLSVGGAPARSGDPTVPVPVMIGVAAAKAVPIYLDGIGTVQASNTVQVRARVDGQITEIRFQEGHDVKTGDILALIDPRPLESNLKERQANLLRDRALLADARANLGRLVQLKEFASRRAVDTQRAEVAQAEARVAADQAQLEYAQTQLDYATIRSPIDGRTGLRQVDVGNLVHAADATPLVTITQLQPIAVLFTLNADHLPVIAKATAAGPLTVLALAKDNRTVLAEGRLDLVDNQIDPATGTIKLKASFANAEHGLWPGQFVNARLRVARHDGPVIAATALQQGPDGAYVWVVKADHTATMRAVTVARLQDGEALIARGLVPGERVVVDGQYKLQQGALIQTVAPVPGS